MRIYLIRRCNSITNWPWKRNPWINLDRTQRLNVSDFSWAFRTFRIPVTPESLIREMIDELFCLILNGKPDKSHYSKIRFPSFVPLFFIFNVSSVYLSLHWLDERKRVHSIFKHLCYMPIGTYHIRTQLFNCWFIYKCTNTSAELHRYRFHGIKMG